MSSHAIVKAALDAHPGLVALVGQKVRIDFAEETDTEPYVVIKRDGLDFIRGLGGQRLGENETFEVECWGKNRSQAIDVSAQAALALEAANLPPDSVAPDGIDPELLTRVAVLSVQI